jgi:lipopolysaccharide/colanic/teichoic acid biosynthesis glycosyltransferase
MSEVALARYQSANGTLVGQSGAPRRISSFRVFDVTLGIIALLAFMPIMAIVALAVWIQDGGPVLYGQRRLGRDGRTFVCLKFRSMFVDSNERLQQILSTDPEARQEWLENHKLKSDPRVTPIGEILRKSSLDELPQLFNVIVGDMSLVGPRPIVEAEIAKYGRYYRHYCSVTPGITGLWQVSGRSDVSYRRRVAMDVAYARSKSLAFDISLLCATVPAVLGRKGSY